MPGIRTYTELNVPKKKQSIPVLLVIYRHYISKKCYCVTAVFIEVYDRVETQITSFSISMNRCKQKRISAYERGKLNTSLIDMK